MAVAESVGQVGLQDGTGGMGWSPVGLVPRTGLLCPDMGACPETAGPEWPESGHPAVWVGAGHSALVPPPKQAMARDTASQWDAVTGCNS